MNDDNGFIQINGVDSADSTNSARAATNYSIYLGQRHDGSMRFNGHISEMIGMDRKLTQLEQSQINHYLATKWGLGNVVDSDADGFTDAEEVLADTDPTDRTSYAVTADFATALSDETGASTGLTAIKDLKVWLDASNSNSITINQSRKIDRWIDLSGHGNTVAQYNTAFQPQLKQDSEFFNTNVIDFGLDEGQIGRSFELNHTNIDINDGFSVYVVMAMKQTASPWNANVFNLGDISYYFSGSNSTAANANVGHKIGVWNAHLVAGQTGLSWDSYYGDTGPLPDTNKAYNEKLTFNDGLFTLDRNSETIKTINGPNKDDYGIFDGADRTKKLTLGYDGTAHSYGYYGHHSEYAEVLVFDRALTATEETIVNAYLSKKWGLTTVMDSDGDGMADAQDEDVVDSGKHPIAKFPAQVPQQLAKFRH